MSEIDAEAGRPRLTISVTSSSTAGSRPRNNHNEERNSDGPSTTMYSNNRAARPPAVFRWTRGDLIGERGSQRSYLAMNSSTGEIIIAKQVATTGAHNGDGDDEHAHSLEALKIESEILKDLDHPNVLDYLGYEQTPETITLFLEYIPTTLGESLQKLMPAMRGDQQQWKMLFLGQILDGLAYIHGQGVIHGDIRADNILLTTNGTCKITNLVPGRCTGSNDEEGTVFLRQSEGQSIFWMAPEVISGMRGGRQLKYTDKADIWSLGCLALEMWSGKRPWLDQDAIAVICEMMNTNLYGAVTIPLDVELSEEAEEFRKLCFAAKPADRPPASTLREHAYLKLPPNWTFNGFNN